MKRALSVVKETLRACVVIPVACIGITVFSIAYWLELRKLDRMKSIIILFAALFLSGCAAVKQETIRNLRSIVPIVPEKPTYTEGPKLYV
jgi:hypothetical protein